MTDDPVDDAVAEERKPGPLKAVARWLPLWFIIVAVFAIGLFGGGMINSAWVSLMGEEQETGLDNAGNVDQRADRMAGEVPVPLARQPDPVVQEVAEVTEPVETVETVDTRQQERRTLAYESPLTPPVADVAQRIRQRQLPPASGSATQPPQRQGAQNQPALTASDRIVAGSGFGVDDDVSPGNRAGAAQSTPAAGTTLPIAGNRQAGTLADTGSSVRGQPSPGSALSANWPHYQLYRGSVIAAVLESAIDSDLPGLVRARTTRDVHDSLTGTHVLIPRGSRLIGVYGQNAGGSLRQGGAGGSNRRRLFVAWQEIRLADGSRLTLDNFSALGADGASGIKARRATGFLEALGAAVLFDLAGNATAILTAATGIGQLQSDTGALANAISGALGNSTQRVGADYVGSLLAGGPRFRVKAGSFMNVIVERDLMLPASAPSPFAVLAPGNDAFATRDEER